ASFVILNLNGKTITGPGSGTATVGIHVLPSSQFALVADGAAVTGFGTGLQFDGKQPFVESVSSESNGIGFVFNGPSANVFGVAAEANLFAGFKVSPTGGGATFAVADSIGNTTGSKLVRVSGVAMYEVAATGNAAFGFWLNGAFDNTITGFTAQD